MRCSFRWRRCFRFSESVWSHCSGELRPIRPCRRPTLHPRKHCRVRRWRRWGHGHGSRSRRRPAQPTTDITRRQRWDVLIFIRHAIYATKKISATVHAMSIDRSGIFQRILYTLVFSISKKIKYLRTVHK